MSQKRKAGDATVTVAHSRTRNLKELTLQADSKCLLKQKKVL